MKVIRQRAGGGGERAEGAEYSIDLNQIVRI
jgi:hypothetical protein